MELRSFLERTGLTQEDIAKVVVKNMSNAGKSTTVKNVLESEPISGQIRKGMCAPVKDAACTFSWHRRRKPNE
jgi:hypothetical protein